MLVFSAFTPHTPLLIPNIGKDNLKKLEKTSQAMQHLAEDLYAAKPDMIVIISGHSECYPDAFAINLNDPYKADLSSLGDLEPAKEFRPDFPLIDHLQRQLRKNDVPVTLHPEEALDYGSSVPLMLLTEQIKGVKIVPISVSGLAPKQHFQFGQALKDQIFDSTQRVAVIATGDLSHTLTSDSPAGFSPNGAKFDDKIQELISQNNAAGLIKLDPKIIKDAQQCGYRALLILFGILDKLNFKSEILSYEAPLGVGYLTVNFEMA